MNNFSIYSKLAFVAAVLALASLATPARAAAPALLRASDRVLAAQAQRSEPWLAAPDGLSSLPEQRAIGVAAGTQDEERLSPAPILGLICAVVASSVALGVALGLRRRIDRIAGPDPEKEADD